MNHKTRGTIGGICVILSIVLPIIFAIWCVAYTLMNQPWWVAIVAVWLVAAVVTSMAIPEKWL